ncbi:MAG TPA: ABC transporter ATP-binding protein [Candidatus Dormibacteraeota bacterium]
MYEGGHLAVDHVSLAIRAGEFFSLLGPSGCGKSTTLRLIAGLEQATTGEIRIQGEAMGGRPANRRPTNLVFQHLALFPHMTVVDNVAFGLKMKRLPSAEITNRVREVLELVQLTGYEKRMPSQLSGGQQQRVAIARALVNRPALLLLDEPLGALDLRLRLQMQIALKQIQRASGTTFVYVTHDQGEAMAMSDRIGIMNDGRLLQVGEPTDLYEKPVSRFVAQFVGDTNLFEGEVRDGLLTSGKLSFRVRGAGSAASVRLEKVRVGERLAGQADNVFDGTLEDTVYLGSFIRYHVRLASGHTVVAQVPNDGRLDIRLGDPVQVGWGVDSAVLVTE